MLGRGHIISLCLVVFIHMFLNGCAHGEINGNVKNQQTFLLRVNNIGEYRVRGAMDRVGDRIRIRSLPGGLHRTLGWWRSVALELTSHYSFRGDILRVEGRLDKRDAHSGSSYGSASVFPYGRARANLKIVDGNVEATLTRGDKAIATLATANAKGFQSDYLRVVAKIQDTFERDYYRPDELLEPWFRVYIEKLGDAAVTARDDLEFVVQGFLARSGVPVSHIGLERHEGCRKPLPGGSGIIAERRESSVYYVKVKHLFQQQENIRRLGASLLHDAGNETLILDLREAYGGDLSAMLLADLVLDHGADGGYFLTAKWWKRHHGLPDSRALAVAHSTGSASVEALESSFLTQDIVRVVASPTGGSFHGEVYVLIGKQTASAAEVLASFLKHNTRAVLVGEPTAGKMLSSARLCVGDGWVLQLPVADYYTSANVRLEGNPVEPDVKVAKQDALAYVQQYLLGKSRSTKASKSPGAD